MLTRVQVLLLDSYDYMMVLVLFQHDGASAVQDSFSFLVACGCGGGWCDASRCEARRLHRAGSGWRGHFPAEARAALSELAWPKVHAPLNRPPPPWSRCSGHRLAARTGQFMMGARGIALARSDNDLLRAVVGRARAPAAGEAQPGASTCGAAASPLLGIWNVCISRLRDHPQGP
jgi:hypothetical protein